MYSLRAALFAGMFASISLLLLSQALVKLCTREGTKKQVASAVCALAALAESHSPSSSSSSSSHSPARAAAVAALREVASARSLAVSNARLASNLAALATFARHFPREFHRHEEKAVAFASARVMGSVGSRDGNADMAATEEPAAGGASGTKLHKGKKRARTGIGSGADSSSSTACQILCASMELLCNCLLAAGAGRDVRVDTSNATPGSADGREAQLLEAVFALLETGGQPAGHATMSVEDRAELRLVGARCVARLCLLSGRVRVSWPLGQAEAFAKSSSNFCSQNLTHRSWRKASSASLLCFI